MDERALAPFLILQAGYKKKQWRVAIQSVTQPNVFELQMSACAFVHLLHSSPLCGPVQ